MSKGFFLSAPSPCDVRLHPPDADGAELPHDAPDAETSRLADAREQLRRSHESYRAALMAHRPATDRAK